MKKIIICADGTWNDPEKKDKDGNQLTTNVWKISKAVLPTDQEGHTQWANYHEGVGTAKGEKEVGGATGFGLWRNILGLYKDLVLNYEEGDQLFFFGFSRGAFTVRSLAGLIRCSGIVRRGHEAHLDEAARLYHDRDPAVGLDTKTSEEFRAKHSHSPDIQFIGVWDTVGAMGVPGLDGDFKILNGLDWRFHDVTLSPQTMHARHALAIHEHRKPFLPTLWERPAGAAAENTLQQVWFTGAHSDVGGGYATTALSDLALNWMIDEATEAGLSIDKAVALGADYRPIFNGTAGDEFNAFYAALGVVQNHIEQSEHPVASLVGLGKNFAARLKQGNFRPSLDDLNALDKAAQHLKAGFDSGIRVYAPSDATRQSIHPSVIERFKLKEKIPKNVWPPTFQTEIERLIAAAAPA